MATVMLFRTYPLSSESWRQWKVDLDGRRVAKIGPAGFVQVKADPGRHALQVHAPGVGVSNPIELNLGTQEPVIVLGSIDGIKDSSAPIQLSIQADYRMLPRSCIPHHGPDGRSQTYHEGMRRARAAVAAFMTGAALLWLAALGILLDMMLTKEDGLAGLSIVLAGFGVFLYAIQRRGFKLLRSQKGWPFETWRIDFKGDESSEWKRTRSPNRLTP